ncbi:MAG: hypothetical protein HY791_23730 [Deltaproteobacteria bacterium]|nr:hypothetical protein [Deltaproteobacteria bacterium]
MHQDFDRPTRARLLAWLLRSGPWLILLMSVAWAFLDAFRPGRGLYFGDATLHFRPRWWFIRESFLALEAPGRTYADPFGAPLEAMLNGAYTPGALLILVGGFEDAYDRLIVGHYLLLAAGVTALAHGLGARWAGSVAAGIVGGLSGPVVCLHSMPVMVVGWAWAPWTYLAFLRLLEAPSVGRAALLAPAFAFHVQGGTPELALLDVIAVIALWVHVRPRLGPRLVALGALSLVLAIGLASPQLVPTFTLLSGARLAGFDASVQTRFSLHVHELAGALAPSFWAPPEAPFVFFPSLVAPDSAPSYFRSTYLGLALPFAMGAVFDRESRWKAVAALAAFGFFVLVALGPATPLHALVVSLPGMSSSRFPQKFAVLALAPLSIAVALGVDLAARAPRILLGCVAAHVTVLALASSTFELPAAREWVARSVAFSTAPFYGIAPEDAGTVAHALMASLIRRALLAAALALLVIGGLRRRTQWLPVALAAALGIDLGGGAQTVLVSSPHPGDGLAELVRRRAPPPARFYAMSPRRPRFVAAEGDTAVSAELHGRQLRGEGLFQGVRRFDDWDAAAAAHPTSSALYRQVTQLTRGPREQLLGRAGVSLYGTDEPTSGAQMLELPGGRHYLVSVSPVRPYVHAYSSWVAMPTPEASTFAALRAFTSTTTWNTAFVHVDTLSAEQSATPDCEEPSLRTAVLDEDSIDAEVESRCRALVVVLEHFNPGWRVSVDGVATQILPAEAGMIAAFVPEGRHTVRFRYESRAASMLPVAGLSACFVLALAWVSWRGSRGSSG